MPKQGMLMMLVAVVLVVSIVVGLAGCKTKNTYNDESMGLAKTLSIYKGVTNGDERRVDLAVDIFNAAVAFDALHGGTGAHLSSPEVLEEWEEYLWKDLRDKGDDLGSVKYGISRDEFDNGFDRYYHLKK